MLQLITTPSLRSFPLFPSLTVVYLVPKLFSLVAHLPQRSLFSHLDPPQPGSMATLSHVPSQAPVIPDIRLYQHRLFHIDRHLRTRSLTSLTKCIMLYYHTSPFHDDIPPIPRLYCKPRRPRSRVLGKSFKMFLRRFLFQLSESGGGNDRTSLLNGAQSVWSPGSPLSTFKFQGLGFGHLTIMGILSHMPCGGALPQCASRKLNPPE